MKVLCSILLISYLALIIPSVPPTLGLSVLLGTIFLITLKKPSLGLIAISFIISSYILVRWSDFNSTLLAGFRSEILIVFISSYILRSILLKDNDLKLPNDFIFFAFIFWCLLCILINSNFNLELFLLAIRENLEVWFLLPIIISIFNRDLRVIKLVAYALVFGTSFIAVINILNYYQLINVGIDAYTTLDIGSIRELEQKRTVLGLTIDRMNPLFGIGPSGGGQYYTSILIQAFLLTFSLFKEESSYFSRKSVRFTIILVSLLISILSLIYASFLTVSISSIGSISIVLITLNARLRLASSVITLLRRIAVFGLGIIFLTTLNLEQVLDADILNPLTYLKDYFIQFGIDETINRADSNFLTGNSLSLRTAASIVGDQGIIDVSWFILIEKFGILGFILGILFSLRYTYIFLRTSVEKYYQYIFTLSGTLFVSLLSYSHSSPIITRPFDYLAMISVAGIYSVVRMK